MNQTPDPSPINSRGIEECLSNEAVLSLILTPILVYKSDVNRPEYVYNGFERLERQLSNPPLSRISSETLSYKDN
jgi:hypothetical protein